MARSWAELPRGRVVHLHGADADSIALSLDPLPEDAPAVVTYFADDARSASEMVTSVLCELEKAAISLFPAWLPGAEGIDGPGGAGRSAVRALALRTASVTGHFGPFLADLAERSLSGVDLAEQSLRNTNPAESPPGSANPAESPFGRVEPTGLSFRGAEPPPARRTRRSARFTPEVRVVGLARVLAASFGRSHASILVHVPTGLSATAEEVLVAGCEWLAHRGELGVWLTGAPLVAVDRVETMTVRLPPAVVSLARDLPEPAVRRPPAARVARTVTYPAVTGVPHPASIAEQALESRSGLAGLGDGPGVEPDLPVESARQPRTAGPAVARGAMCRRGRRPRPWRPPQIRGRPATGRPTPTGRLRRTAFHQCPGDDRHSSSDRPDKAVPPEPPP